MDVKIDAISPGTKKDHYGSPKQVAETIFKDLIQRGCEQKFVILVAAEILECLLTHKQQKRPFLSSEITRHGVGQKEEML